MNGKRYSVTALLLMVCFGASVCKAADSKADHGTAIRLFNNKDLSNFYVFLKDRGRNNDPKQVFTVDNGILRVSGEEWGLLTSEKEYENYRLVVEYKWGKKTFDPRKNSARDSGIWLIFTRCD